MPDLSDLRIKGNLRIKSRDKHLLKLGSSRELSSPTPYEHLSTTETIPMLNNTPPEQNNLRDSPTDSSPIPLYSMSQQQRHLQSSPPNTLLPRPSLVTFSATKTRAFKPKLVFRQTMPRHIPPSIAISSPISEPHFVARKNHRSAQTSLSTVLHPWNASLYASHFPPGHILDAIFVSKYAPGAEVGSGAYGFVVTAIDVASSQYVAVKFVEKRKIPSWGWCHDPELGEVPVEVKLLRTLDHPGIIKFIELFQDSIYFYVVQELHGSPWSGRKSSNSSKIAEEKSLNVLSDNTMDSSVLTESTTIAAGVSNYHVDFDSDSSDILMTDHDDTIRPSPLSSSSSASSSDTNHSSNPIIPKITGSTPLKFRNNIPKLSYDLFECIEQHQRFSEVQARFIFRQIVDVVYYLDRLGIYHRDIKDENILIDNKYRVKLVDFGSAIRTEPEESLFSPRRRPWFREFRGTLAYAPPEILSRTNKYHQVDAIEIWSLGLLLGFLLTGRNVFPTQEDILQGTMRLPNGCRILTEDEEESTPMEEIFRYGGNPSPQWSANYSSSKSKAPGVVISSSCYNLLTRCLDTNPMTRITIAEVKAHPWLRSEYLNLN